MRRFALWNRTFLIRPASSRICANAAYHRRLDATPSRRLGERREGSHGKKTLEKQLGLLVKARRQRLSLGQLELARRAGFHRSYVSDIERGARNISLQSLGKLAAALELPLSGLFSELEHTPPSAPLQADELVDVLVAQAGDEDVRLVIQCLKNAHLSNRLFLVRDGAAVLDFVFCAGPFAHRRPNDPPRVIVLDLDLPRIGGLELLRRLKHEPRTRSIPLIVLTSGKNEDQLGACKRLGADAFIVKPADLHKPGIHALQLSLQWALLPP